jgi:hypothetical protein
MVEQANGGAPRRVQPCVQPCVQHWADRVSRGLCGVSWISLLVLAVSPPVSSAEESLAERRQRLQSMTPAQKAELESKKGRFDGLPPEEQEELKRLHESIDQHPNADQLREVMEGYFEWLKTLSQTQRLDLRKMNTQDRIAAIKSFLKKQDEERFRQLARRNLSPEDREAILAWLDDFLERRKEKIDPLIEALFARWRYESRRRGPPSRMHGGGDAHPQRKRRRLLFSSAFSARVFAARPGPPPSPRPGEKPPSADDERRRKLVEEALRPSDEDWRRLEETLSSEARDALNSLRKEEPEKKQELLLRWAVAAAVAAVFPRPPTPSDEELNRFVAEDLSDAHRDWLQSVPSERLRQETLSLYDRYRSGRGPSRWPRGWGRGGGERWRPSDGGRGMSPRSPRDDSDRERPKAPKPPSSD